MADNTSNKLKISVSKILQRGFASRGVSIDRRGNRFWSIKHENDGVVLVDLNPRMRPPAQYMALRGVIVDTVKRKIVSFGFGYPEIIHSNESSQGLLRDDPNVVIRPGVEGIIIRMFRIRGVLYYSSYKTLQAGGNSAVQGKSETYRESFRRLLATNYNIALEDFEANLFPRATCNYSHTFHLVTRDFLKITSLPHEDIYLVNTETFGPGNVVPPPVSFKPIMSVEAAVNFYTGVVCEKWDGPTVWTGQAYKSNREPQQLGNFLVIEVYRPYKNSIVLDRTYELYSPAWEYRESILASEGNLYSSFVRGVKQELNNGVEFDQAVDTFSNEMLRTVNPLHEAEVARFSGDIREDSNAIYTFAHDWRWYLSRLEDYRADQLFNNRSRSELQAIEADYKDKSSELLTALSSSSFYYLATRVRKYGEHAKQMLDEIRERLLVPLAESEIRSLDALEEEYQVASALYTLLESGGDRSYRDVFDDIGIMYMNIKLELERYEEDRSSVDDLIPFAE